MTQVWDKQSSCLATEAFWGIVKLGVGNHICSLSSPVLLEPFITAPFLITLQVSASIIRRLLTAKYHDGSLTKSPQGERKQAAHLLIQ